MGLLLKLLGKFNPYLRWIKLGAVIALVLGAAWMGREWERRGCNTEKLVAVETAMLEYRASVEELKTALVRQQAHNTAVVKEKQALESKLRKTISQHQKEIRNATEKYKPTPDAEPIAQPRAVFTVEFGRVWNDAIARANSLQGVPATAYNPTGTEAPDLRPSDIDRESILGNHAALMEELGECRRTLKAIYDWDAAVLKETK